MRELIIYRGLPGSGKTRHARMTVAGLGGCLVGRDHLRPLVGIVGGVGTPDQEHEVTRLQETLIRNGLRADQRVYVDDMNLRAKYVRRLIEIAISEGSPYRIKDLTDRTLDECVLADAERGASGGRLVGAEVINDIYRRFVRGKGYPLSVPEVRSKPELNAQPYVPPVGKPTAVLIDLDGTVADHEGVRGHHDYHLVGLDRPKPHVIRAVRAMMMQGAVPIFMSGRPDSCRPESRVWINRHVTLSGDLYMRRTGDRRDDAIVKLELFNRHVRDNYRVVGVFDDRDRVVRMWRKTLGLTTFQVDYGDF